MIVRKVRDIDANYIKSVHLRMNENIHIAEINGTIVGLVEYYELSEHGIYIEYITIKEQFRRKGVGRQIIKYFLDSDKYICGDAIGESLLFWESMGCVFDECDAMVKELIEGGNTVPFIIE